MFLTKNNLSIPIYTQKTFNKFLTSEQLDKITDEFSIWYEKKRTKFRCRYWLVFLFLKYTGAKVSQIIQIDESEDIDFINPSVRIRIQKLKNKSDHTYRIIPIPRGLISEYSRIVRMFPLLKGEVFKIKRNNFFIVYRKLSIQAGIPLNLAHPNVLRHTYAINLLNAGLPLTAVQLIMGHKNFKTTAKYMVFNNYDIYNLMKFKNLI